MSCDLDGHSHQKPDQNEGFSDDYHHTQFRKKKFIDILSQTKITVFLFLKLFLNIYQARSNEYEVH